MDMGNKVMTRRINCITIINVFRMYMSKNDGLSEEKPLCHGGASRKRSLRSM